MLSAQESRSLRAWEISSCNAYELIQTLIMLSKTSTMKNELVHKNSCCGKIFS